MSDEKDHSEHATHQQVSKEINFEWTPELVKLVTSRGLIHPLIGPLDQDPDGFPKCIYRPGMTLPDPADTRGCLNWVGLSEEKILEVERKFKQLYPDYQAPRCGYDEKHLPRGLNEITFPTIDKMLDIFFQGLDQGLDIDSTEPLQQTHEAYIEKGIQEGLRPEFAIFCGMHKDDPRATEDPDLFNEFWFTKGPQDFIADSIIPSSWTKVKDFLEQRLIHEGKAWQDHHGRWLVHEGESMEQAKARVDDQELQRLRQKASEEYKARREQERQEIARLDAEDKARWAEEERLEAEMSKKST
ncbi:hypothetical protein NUU61_001031 [Penicillium alfredii]|uniref:Uncharacterized protein n=1 Tax=Penicillium alfredii TaxID=1506179 RepID=A0A9W9GB19_9EURO|nr:uncharacterized protein NUU61_001031 [Penicillium alfredii]KAJ5115272.1 hypothetical protein NUU61_001031 [Penicillium alfredii]